MGRPRKTQTQPVEEDLDLRPDEVDFVDFLENIGDNGSTVEVYRIPRNGDPEWLDVLAFDIIRDGGQQYIRDTYGPGKYKLMFKDSLRKYQGRKTFVLGGAPVTAAPAVVNNGAGDPRFEFLTAQMAQDRALMFKLIENMGKGGPTPTDPAAMLTAVVAAFSVLRQGSDPAAPGNPTKQLKETLELLASTKDIFGPGEPKEENMYTVVKELGQQFLGRTAGPTAPGRLPASTVQTLHPGTQFRVTPLRPGANGAGTEALSSAEGDEVNPKDAVMRETNAVQWIKAGLEYLKTKCKLGKPVELYMDLVWDHQEEPQFAALLQAIGSGATFENLLTFDEEIAQTPGLKTWFEQLYNAIHKEVFEPMDTSRAGGHQDHAPGNAAPGAAGSPEPGSSGAGGGSA